jgi:acyl-CoA thioesterase-1
MADIAQTGCRTGDDMARDIRICFFGDSFVNGIWDEAYLGWPGRLSARLRAQGLELTSYNLGIRRDTSSDIRARWRTEAARRLPDHVAGHLVFSFGVNDCIEEAGMLRVACADSLENARQILAAAAAWKPTLVIGPPSVIMTDQGDINRRIAAVSAGLQGVCATHHIPYLDLCARLRDHRHWAEEIAAGDGVHPTSAGYERIADIIQAWPEWNRRFPIS